VLTDVAVVADATLVFPSAAILLFVVVGNTVVSSLLDPLSVIISRSLELRGVTAIVVTEGAEDLLPIMSTVGKWVVVSGLEVVASLVVMFVIFAGCVEVEVVTLVVAVCVAVVVSSVMNPVAGMCDFVVVSSLYSEVMTGIVAAGVVTICLIVEDWTSSLVVISGVTSILASIARDIVAEVIAVPAVEVIRSVFTPLVVN